MRRYKQFALVTASVAALAGCRADDEQLTAPVEPVGNASFMERYVAMGNSLTAGLQSGGLSDSLQMLAYPVLVARQAGVPFTVPLLRGPGCPAPYRANALLDTVRIGGTATAGPPSCSLRSDAAPRFLQNVAYPGAYMQNAIDNSFAPNPESARLYQSIFLGGRTPVQAMVDAQPTFVSVWYGNNETLVPAVAGAAGTAADFPVSVASFTAALDSVVRAIKRTPAAAHALLVAPVNALSLTPLVQPGAFLFALEQDPAARALLRARGKTVAADCAPQLFGLTNYVSLRVALLTPQITTISCADAAPGVIGLAERAFYTARVNEYKAAVRNAANANGFAYFDPDEALRTSLADPAKFRKCQGLVPANIATPAAFAQAVATTCPSLTAASPFGTYISFDATHPASPAHREVANAVIQAINTKYGSTIPTL